MSARLLRGAEAREAKMAEQRSAMMADRQRLDARLARAEAELRIADAAGRDREAHWKWTSSLRIALAELDNRIASCRDTFGHSPGSTAPTPIVHGAAA